MVYSQYSHAATFFNLKLNFSPHENAEQFLAVVRRHVDHDDNIFAATNDGGGGHEHHGIHGQQRHSEAGDISSKVEEVFKQMDVRGDGEVSWEDFSQVTYIQNPRICDVPRAT